MKKIVALPLLADPRMGGWPTYTAHLAHGLISAGWEPVIFRLAKRSEKKPRHFGRGLDYWNISFNDLLELTHTVPTLITAVGKNHRETARDLMAEGANVVIHDPTELDAMMREAISVTKVFTIRKIISDNLKKIGIDNQYLPHPYQRATPVDSKLEKHAVSLSRVDFDKNTHLIVEANKLLPEDKRIVIHGALNRLYAKFKLEETDPRWWDNYAGEWPASESTSAPLRIANSANMVIDLSTIKNDGGGTQYSFLEVFDAGKPLVIHSGWLTGNPDYDEIAPAVYCAVDSPESLAEAVMGEPSYDKSEAEIILNTHEAGNVARNLMEAMLDASG